MAEWFQEWFGEEYLQLYPHRDAGDAERLAALIEARVPGRRGARLLDVGCGPGRHLAALEKRGYRGIGLDLSASLLRRARAATLAPLVRADMRWLPVRPATFDVVVNLFTSFGYFATDDEHGQVVAQMGAALKPGGWLAMDFLNAPAVEAGLVPAESTVLGNTLVQIRRRIERGAVIKTIETADGRRFVERVRLFREDELKGMMREAGLAVRSSAGDYAGSPVTRTSPRVILFAERQ
ncbi:MAG TPA: class I SAM-dependent methyltransferase [Gemmatimonadales bacterium]|nr:class I SAM-dependent methyltransferase [Gemmatimonadales bacterium]